MSNKNSAGLIAAVGLIGAAAAGLTLYSAGTGMAKAPADAPAPAAAAPQENSSEVKSVAFQQSSFGPGPVAKKVPVELEKHGDVRVDPYFWMRDPEYPTVNDEDTLNHLKAENAYLEKVLGGEESPLRKSLFDEMLGRIKQDDTGVPYVEGGWEYQVRFETGKQHPIYVRRPAAGGGEFTTILDVNQLAEGKEYMRVTSMEVSPDGKYLAYTEDDDGSEMLAVKVKDLTTGEYLPDVIDGASYGLAWANDNRTLFYAIRDEYQRPKKIFRHTLGAEQAADTLVYEETEGPWTAGVGKTLSGRFIVIVTDNNATNEVRLIPADDPAAEPIVLAPRQTFRQYDVAEQDGTLWILVNDTHRNFRLVKAPADNPAQANWEEVIAGSDDVYLMSVMAFKDWLFLFERDKGNQRVRVIAKDGTEHFIAFPDAAYDVSPSNNAEYDSNVLRVNYTSLVTPATVYDYDLTKRELAARKVQEIPSGYDASLYTSERLMAPARDGRTMIPISIVYRKDRPANGTAPLHVYGYGSYGIPSDPTFSTARMSLLDRGFAFAILHVRGGDDMGRGWYEDGKLEHKVNSFTDFIDATQYLVQQGYAKAGNVSMSGGSAGGLLMGAVMNMAPDGLYKAAVAYVPFVDVVSTMLDETLPLTAGEYDEWGNPNQPDAYFRMKGYSPYDNVAARNYPHILITAGLTDPRVTYWEPAKWAARLRELKTDDNVLLSYTNMGAGHGGASGRFDRLKEIAMAYAFLVKAHGVE
ncbi:S9 family peptidase [Indioceanicola profundi]|uniref:S9 family peptidase n=1 Tax=Indioceanicola profundi TaxID=2220096 RepID=UPI000E6AB0E7|nr:S9 family peptidase [Indioceanicola profundi]